MSTVAVHDAWFVSPCRKRGVVCVAGDRERNRVAVIRVSGCVEIWAGGDSPHLKYSLEPDYSRDELKPRPVKPDQEAGGQDSTPFWATAATWTSDGRLFAVGAHGYVFEILIDRYRCAGRLASSGLGTPTAIAANGRELVVGTANGHLVVFRVDADGPETGPCFDRNIVRVNESAVVSVSWQENGENIAVVTADGAVGVVRVAKSKLSKLHIPSVEDKGLSALMLDDGNMVTGHAANKSGMVCFWDGRTRTILSSFSTPRAGVTVLAKSSDDKTVYCGGLDPVLYVFTKCDANRGGQPAAKYRKDAFHGEAVMRNCYKPALWTASVKRKLHSRAVLGMARVDPWLVSGSADGEIYFFKFPPSVELQFPPVLNASRIQILKKARRLMVAYADRVEFHSLREMDWNENVQGEPVNMDVLVGRHPFDRRSGADGSQPPVRADSRENDFFPGAFHEAFDAPREVLRIEPPMVATGGYITSAAALDDGSLVAYSVSGAVRLMSWRQGNGDGKSEKRRVKFSPDDDSAVVETCQKLAAYDSGFLSVTSSGSLQVFDCSDRLNPKAGPVFQFAKSARKADGKLCLALCASADGRSAGVAFCDGAVYVVDPLRRVRLRRLPNSQLALTAMALNPDTGDVVIAYANRSVLEFAVTGDGGGGGNPDPVSGSLTNWGRRWSPPEWWSSDPYPVTCLIPHGDTHFLLADTRSVYLADKEKSLSDDMKERGLTCVTACSFIAFFGALSPDEFLCVYQTPDDYTKDVAPPPFKERKFGKN